MIPGISWYEVYVCMWYGLSRADTTVYTHVEPARPKLLIEHSFLASYQYPHGLQLVR